MGTNLNDLNSLLQLEMDQRNGRLIFTPQKLYHFQHTHHILFFFLKITKFITGTWKKKKKNHSFDVRIVLQRYPLKLAC